jgi:ribonucleoside-diphosphate reductase alpha chain
LSNNVSSDLPSHDKQTMVVRKRDGSLQPVNLQKILKAITRASAGIKDIDPMRVASKTIGGLYDGASTLELDQLSIQTAASLIGEDPAYSKLASSLLSEFIRKEVTSQGVQSFSQAIRIGFEQGLISEKQHAYVKKHQRKLDNAVRPEHDAIFEYFGLRTVYDRYLLRHPITRKVIETPQYFLLRVASALMDTVPEAIDFYQLMSTGHYLPSSPTLFNAGTRHPQMSSCYLHALPTDSLVGIYSLQTEMAKNSKFAGGLGTPFYSVRSEGSLIKGTNGRSNGIIPWLAMMNMSVAAVDQGGRRRGAACIYMAPWHADFEQFLELRDNTGDHSRRAHNLNLAHWVPDVFMEAVEKNGDWHMFDPKDTPQLLNSFGKKFREAYQAAVEAGLSKKVVKAHELYGRMMRTLAETGNGWMCFSDPSNEKCNQTLRPEKGHIVRSSNLCTEITEVAVRRDTEEESETAVCNLGSFVLPSYVGAEGFDFAKLAADIPKVIRQLDNVIDNNFYPVPSAAYSNKKWRPVGLGVMGLQDVFFQLGLPFDSAEALKLSTDIAECIYFHALTASASLAVEKGSFPAFSDSRTSEGLLQFHLWGLMPSEAYDWAGLLASIKSHGLRNSLLIAIAPTATIGSIMGVYECVEPQTSNLFKRETLSGEFLQVNRYLVRDLKEIGLWNDEVRTKVKVANGSIQGIEEIPEKLRLLYRTTWELSQKALIDMAAARGPYIDQSQSINLFMESPNIGRLSSMYLYAWKKGLKTTYYLRSRPATSIAKTTVAATSRVKQPTPAEAVSCSLESPESCEACQ